jgi:hypothetical protein
VVLGLLFHIHLAWGGSLPLFNGFCFHRGRSPKFLPGMSWRDQQSSWVFKVGDSLEGDDPEGGVVVYPRVVQDARLCFRMMGFSFKGTKKGFLDFLTLIDEGQHSAFAPKKKRKRKVNNLECSINFDARVVGSSRVRASLVSSPNFS